MSEPTKEVLVIGMTDGDADIMVKMLDVIDSNLAMDDSPMSNALWAFASYLHSEYAPSANMKEWIPAVVWAFSMGYQYKANEEEKDG